MIGRLHDHLAARTIENPDFEHRVRRLGLERHVRELDEQGYTVIERAVTEAMADELREVVQREVLAHHPFTTNGLLLRDRLFEEVAQHPLACDGGRERRRARLPARRHVGHLQGGRARGSSGCTPTTR